MTSAKYGGMRNGNSNVISARSAASSWKLMLLAPPPARAASKTRASAGMSGAVSVSFGMKSREMKSSPMLRGDGWAVREAPNCAENCAGLRRELRRVAPSCAELRGAPVVVAVDQMGDRLDHPILLLLRHLGHQPEVEDDELALRRAHHVPRVRVRVEEAGVEELREVRDDAEVDQRADVVRLRLRELLALDPLRGVHAARGVLRVVLRDHDPREHPHVALDAQPVLALDDVVEFLVEVVAVVRRGVERVVAVEEVEDGG